MASADESIPVGDRAKWATYPILAVQGWAQHHNVRLRAVVATEDQFKNFDPGTAKITLQSDDIPDSGKMQGRNRLEVIAPGAASRLAGVNDTALSELLPPAPSDTNPPADETSKLWFEVMKPMMSTNPDRGVAHLEAFVNYAEHAQEQALYRAHTAAEARRATRGDRRLGLLAASERADLRRAGRLGREVTARDRRRLKVLRVGISKVERLMNLVIALLSTRTFITAERIRETVYGYADSATDEAFSRMFERDKNELRDLGIPLETGRVSQFDPTEGYRINRDAYALPAVELTADEAAAVAVATQLWESPELITATQGALLKLRAAGVDVDAPDSGIAITSTAVLPGLRGSEDVLGILLSAIDSGQAVQFPHRPSRSDPYTTRTVEPWGVVTDRGRWYLVGHDRDRDATRTFRLSRIGADVTPIGPPGAVKRPDGINLREIVDRAVGEWPNTGQARVWVADGRATALRRRATVVGPLTLGDRAGEEITVDIGMLDRLAREIASYGPDAVALEPQSLRDDVLARLRAQAGQTDEVTA